ncbi:hypothetical protein JOM56_007018, partial [Amanita muscaria]
TGKAAGLDGIPYELWKQTAARSKSDRTAFNVCGALKLLYNDIEKHGTSMIPEFSD